MGVIRISEPISLGRKTRQIVDGFFWVAIDQVVVVGVQLGIRFFDKRNPKAIRLLATGK